jgi:DNA-binding XRE family transcriptional regulator
MSNPRKTIYNESTFRDAFWSDLKNALAFVWIESAYISFDGVKRFKPVFQDLIERGVRICVFVQEPQGWAQRHCGGLDPVQIAEFEKLESAIKLVRSLGMHANLRPRTHAKYAVIDYRISWTGSLNILSYTRHTDEEIWRSTDETAARDIIDRRRFNTECIECNKIAASREPIIIDPNSKSIGLQIGQIRRNAMLSQEQLAKSIGVTRETICCIERGKYFPQADLLIRIHIALGGSVTVIPAKTTPIIEHVVDRVR